MDAFNKIAVSGRPKSYLLNKFSNEYYTDVTFANYGIEWQTLRHLALSTINKHLLNNKIIDETIDCMDKIIRKMLANEGPDKPIAPLDYIFIMYLNIVNNCAFGENLSLDDPHLKRLKYLIHDFYDKMSTNFMLWEYSAIFRWFDYRLVKQFNEITGEARDILVDKFTKHYKSYDPSVERDLCDSLIAAKLQTKTSADSVDRRKHLSDMNLTMILYDLTIDAADTFHGVFQWILLFLANYPLIQKQLRMEIKQTIGDRRPQLDDKNRCPRVMAFIAETIRLRAPNPFGAPHQTLSDTTIGNYSVPKGTRISVNLGYILCDSKHWGDDSHTFRADRFITTTSNGSEKLDTNHKAFVPFGIGRRKCMGTKLAIAVLFISVVRLIQITDDYTIVLDSHMQLDPDSNSGYLTTPHNYNILFKSKTI